GARTLRHAVGFAGDAGGQRAPGAGLQRWAERHRPLHAHQRGGRPRGGSAGRASLRDAHRSEALRQPARCRHGDDSWRGKRRHRIGPCARKGRAVGSAASAQHPGRARYQRGPTRARTSGALWPQLLRAARLRSLADRYRRRPDRGTAGQAGDAPGPAFRPADRRAGRQLLVPRSGRWLDQRQPGVARAVRRRFEHHVPPVRHRHRRRHAARLSG
ncbi:hypothetical protein OY671_009342, partial [Metschnikowia pulcherrima]